MILFQALKMRARDVHFQPFPDRLQVRYRIDGVLYDMESAARRRCRTRSSRRVKVMGKMDIAERRLPQDGRATMQLGDGDVDVRISSVPTSHGERIVMRLLDKSARRLRARGDRARAGQPARSCASTSSYQHGIILVTGPHRLGQDHHALRGAAEGQLRRR